MEQEGQLRVWWISNPPSGKMEHYYVNNAEQAKIVLATLAHHDLNLGDNLIFCNSCGLEIFEDGEWGEYIDEEGEEINTDEVFVSLKGDV